MKRLLVSMLTCGLLAGIVYGQALVKTGDRAKRGYKETDFPRAKQLAPGVYSYEALRGGDPGGQMTTNSLIVITTDGVLVADGQGGVQQTQEMVDWIKKTTNQPIKYVVICSDHGDHTGGNTAFPEGVTFIAHPTSKATLERGNSPRIPSETVPHRRVLKMGNTDIEILFLGRAHTGGDLSVYLPRERVLFMSEAFLHRIFPAMRSAYPTEWVETVRNAESMNATWYIPGHGFVDDAASLKQELAVYRQAMERVVSESKRLHAEKVPCPAPPPAARGGGGGGGGRGAGAGRGAEGAGQRGQQQAPPRPLCEAAQKANWGDLKEWTLFQGQVETSIRKVWDELDGKLP
ncbi:MAG: MBL fold metallo-hydrolase [Acidobacteria bacterium]|nr:MBL fold metallo-hydrolase [Acidobacteriota bacterium]